jgi:predicted O-methyltransferase YrrM
MRPPVHDPAAIYRYRDCLAAADCLCAAIVHLDLFTLLERQPNDVSGICRALAIQARPVEVMLTLCAANGLVARDPQGVYRVTGLAREFLVAGAACDARPYYASMAGRPGVADWLKVLRTGRPANWPGVEGEADWHAAMRTEEFAESFTAAMDCRGRVLAAPLAAACGLADARRLLDVGGGSGVYAIAAVEAHPALRATVLEHPPVDRIARRAIATAGCGDRVSVVVADMFAVAWPVDHDVHLFSNVLHDWDEPDCRRLLERSAASLPAGGRIVVHDMFLDDAKDGPLWAAEYSVLLAGVTNGRLYAAGEIAAWGQALGFVASKPVSLPLGRGFVVLSRQP